MLQQNAEQHQRQKVTHDTKIFMKQRKHNIARPSNYHVMLKNNLYFMKVLKFSEWFIDFILFHFYSHEWMTIQLFPFNLHNDTQMSLTFQSSRVSSNVKSCIWAK